MLISEVKQIDKKVMKYINSKTSKGYSISNIIQDELGVEVDKKLIEQKRNLISKKIKRAGYKFNKETKIYELTIKSSTKHSDNSVKSSTEHSDNSVESSTKHSDNQKRKYITKKERDYLEKISNNHLYYELDIHNLIGDIDYIYEQIKSDNQKIGIRLHDNVVDLFKVVGDRYGYLDFYLLVNAAIYSLATHSTNLKTSNWLIDYSNFISATPTKGKKQVNLNSSKMTYNQITIIQQDFPILDRSEVVNLALFIYAKCFIKKNEDK